MTGLTTGPIIGDLAQQLRTPSIPFGAFEGQEPFELSQQVGRAAERFDATYGGAVGDAETGMTMIPPEPKISAEEAQAKYGIGDLKFTAPVPESVAEQLHDSKQAEIDRAFVSQYSPGGFWNGAARFGAGFVMNALDPINVAASFVPVVGEARYARWLADAGGALGRTAVRAGVGAVQGAAGQVPLTALHYGLSQAEGADYSAGDAMLDIAYGTLLGGGLHAALGPLFDRVPEKEAAPVTEADLPTREAALRIAISQMDQGLPVEVTAAFDAARLNRELTLEDRLMSGTALRRADFMATDKPEIAGLAEAAGQSPEQQATLDTFDRAATATPTDIAKETAGLQQAIDASPEHLAPEDHAQLAALSDAAARSNQMAKGFDQAAACIARGLG